MAKKISRKFIKGTGSVIDILPKSHTRRLTEKYPRYKTNREAISSDWEKVFPTSLR